jgi:hypothetical protein
MARQIIRQERFIVNSFKNASTLIEQKLLCKSIAKTDAETVNAYNELKESVIQSIANISDEWTNVKDKELVVTAAGKELIVSEWHYKNIVVTITSDARNTNSVIFDDTYLITRSDFEAPIEVKAAVKYDTEVGPQIFVTARIVLNRYDVATGELVDTVINHVPADGILYFNNGNAPVMEDYDFVMMDGIRYEDALEGGTFSVWYVQHSVADPTATTLSAIGTVTTNNDVKNTYSLELTNSTSLVSTSGRNTLTEPKRINTSNLIDASALFKYGYYITSIPDLDTSNVTNMREMFFHCDRLQEIPYMDTSSVINMQNIFAYTSLLQGPTIDTSSVTNASYMFYNCGSLTDIPVYDFSNVTNLQYAFSGCTSLTSIPNIDYSNLTNIEHMFENCTGLTNAITISLDSVTTGNSAFNGVTVPLTISNLDSYTNSYSLINDYDGPSLVVNSAAKLTASNATTTPTSTSGYYYGLCLSKRVQQNDTNALRTVEIYNTPLLTNATRMFSYRNGLESVTMPDAPVLSNTDYMFAGCSSLVDVDLSSTTNITSATYMFYGCIRLTEISDIYFAEGAAFSHAFASCTALTSVTFNTQTSVAGSHVFGGCTSLTTIVSPNNTLTFNGTHIFYGCKSLVDLSDLAITASNPSAMFSGCTALEHLGDMNFTGQRLNTQKYHNRSGYSYNNGLDTDVFYNCTKIKSFGNITITDKAYDFLPTISYFKSTLESIGNIISDGWGGTTPSSFFSSCTALRTVGDISCANFTTLSSLFTGCTALESVGNITATAATQFSNMFKNCSSLTQVGVITVNANATYTASNFTDMFTGCSSLTEVTIANIQNTTVEETLIANFPNITFTFI